METWICEQTDWTSECVCVCVCVFVGVVVCKMPVWGSHRAGSDLTLAHCSSTVPAATFSFPSEVFWRIFSPSQSRNDTVWLWSSHSGSIYKTASCSGTDSLSACSRKLTSHTHTNTHIQRNHQYQDCETLNHTPETRRGFWERLLTPSSQRCCGDRDSGSGALPAV